MSRIGKKPVSVPSSVSVELNDSARRLKVSGPKGDLTYDWHSSINVSNDDGAGEHKDLWVASFAP